MLIKFTHILLFGLTAFFFALFLYPSYIKLLQRFKAGKTIRDDTVTGDEAVIFKELHLHKAGTPTMGGGLFLIIMLLMMGISRVIYKFGLTNHTIVARSETYMLLFAFFSMGILGLIDDILNIKGTSGIKGLTAKMKFLWMFLFSGFISYWFYSKLGIDFLNLWPFAGEVQIGFFSAIFMFFFTVALVNAINITDGLDGLVGGLSLSVLAVLAVITFISQRYIATTVISIVLGMLLAFLWYNINPARIFMGDSGALAIGGLIATLTYLANIRIGIIIPCLFLFLIFWVELGTSFLQIMRKKVFKKKLFLIAPFHHLLEKRGMAEHTIVMRFRLIQVILSVICLVMMFYQSL